MGLAPVRVHFFVHPVSLRCPYCTAEVELEANECGHCGSALEKPLSQGDLLDGRFDVRRVLGFGALGTTYLARDRVARTELLLKILSPQLVPTLDDCEQLGTQLEMFEGRVIAGSAMHIEVGLADNLLFVTYPPIQGVSLREVLEARALAANPLTKEEALRLLLGIVASVSALHSATPHGALRPENIMITPKGVILTNGAIVGAVNPDYFQPRMRGYAQAVPYIAPEVMAGKKVTATADLFAIGAIAAELLTGSPSAHALDGTDLSPPILQGIRQLLERDRTKRPGGQALILNELCKTCGLDRRPPDAPLALPDPPPVVEDSDDSTTVSAAPTKPAELTPAHGRAYVGATTGPTSVSAPAPVSSSPPRSAANASPSFPPAPQASSAPASGSPQAITQPSLPAARMNVGKPALPSPPESPIPAVKSTLPSSTIPRSGIPGGPVSSPPSASGSPTKPPMPSTPKPSVPVSTTAAGPSASARGSVPPPAGASTRPSVPPRSAAGPVPGPSAASMSGPTLAKVPPATGLPSAVRGPSIPSASSTAARPSMPSVPKLPEAPARPAAPSIPKAAANPAPRVPNLAGLDLGKPSSPKPVSSMGGARPADPQMLRASRDADANRGGFSDIDTGEIELLDD